MSRTIPVNLFVPANASLPAYIAELQNTNVAGYGSDTTPALVLTPAATGKPHTNHHNGAAGTLFKATLSFPSDWSIQTAIILANSRQVGSSSPTVKYGRKR